MSGVVKRTSQMGPEGVESGYVLRRLISKYLALQDGLSELVGRTIAWITPVMVLILLIEIAARYFFNSPTVWAHELTAMLYGTLCMLAGAYTLRHRGHVRSEVIYQLFGKRGKALLDLISYLLGLVALTVFFLLAYDFAAESWQINEISSKGTWQPVIYPFKTVMPVAIAMVILQSVAELLRSLCILLSFEIDDPRARENESLI